MSKQLNRRAFIATGALATAGWAITGPRPAGADTQALTVYRLSADWGFPIGPKGKTRCACRSCFRRAENGYFLTEAAALAGRVHPCCVCQPYTTTLEGVSSEELFLNGQSADRRDPRVSAVLAGAAVTTNASAAPTTGDPSRAAAAGFARTGTSLRLANIGACVLAAGGALLLFRNRGSTAPHPQISTANQRKRHESRTH